MTAPVKDVVEAVTWLRESEQRVINPFVRAKYGDAADLIESLATQVASMEAMKKENERWVPVTERLPEKRGAYIAWVACAASEGGGYSDILTYGKWDFYDMDGDWEAVSDEEGQVSGEGWYRDQEERGESMIYPLQDPFNKDERVTHWMLRPAAPNTETQQSALAGERQSEGEEDHVA